MIVGWRSIADVYRENLHCILDTRLAVVEVGGAVHLGGRHPQPTIRGDPHGINPDEARIVDQGRDFSRWRDLKNRAMVRVRDVDVPLKIDSGTSGGAIVDEGASMFRALGI